MTNARMNFLRCFLVRLTQLLRSSKTARYLAAGICTLGLNVFFLALIGSTGRQRGFVPPEPETVAFSVVDRTLAMPSPLRAQEANTADVPGEQEQEVAQTVSAHAMPALELSQLSRDPAGLRVTTSPGLTSLEMGLSIPSVSKPATAGTDGTPGLPGGGMGSGPMLLEPPDLSAYYPPSALRKKITGTTELQVVVDESGRTAQVVVVASTPGGIFEVAAQRLGQSLLFRPAQEGGKPIAARTRITLHWTLD